MDYEQDKREKQIEEQAEERQAEDIEIDEDDAPYLDLRDDRERQAYAMIKKSKLWSYQGLQIRTFSRKQVWTLTSLVFGMWLDGMVLCPLRSMVLVPSPSSFFALFGRWTMVFLSDFLELNAILIGEISVTSLVLARACQFSLQKLAAVLIDMSFGV